MAGDPSIDELLALMVPQTLHAESRGRDFGSDGRPVTSSAGARYAMQVMPGTGGDPGFGVRPASNPNDPSEVNRVGRDYLGAMLKRYGMDPAKAWAAYNGGPGRVDKALAAGGDWLSRMPGETRAYVANNLASLNGGVQQPVPPTQPTNPMPSPAMTDSPLASLGQGASAPDPAAPAQPSALDTLNKILTGYQSLDSDRAAMRQQQLETATAALQQQRKGLSSADLFRISAALAAPQRSKGFGGMMANVAPVLGDVMQAHEQSNLARRQALASLSQTYMGGMIDDRGKSLGNQLDVAKAIATADKPDKSRQTWSEASQQYFSPDQRQPVAAIVHNGLNGVKFSDGTAEFVDPSTGTTGVYDAAWRFLGSKNAPHPPQGQTPAPVQTPPVAALPTLAQLSPMGGQ